MKTYRQGVICCVLAGLAWCTAQTSAVELFNGSDLTGWTCGQTPWAVTNGILRNTGEGNDFDWIMYNTPLSSGAFSLEMRMMVVDYDNDWPRPRVHLNTNTGNFYFGNEGFTNQYEIYGNALTNVAQVGDDTYSAGFWHTLRVEVNAQNQVSFYKDNLLTHTGLLTNRLPLNIAIHAGDNWSRGHIKISSVTYTPEPATLFLFGTGFVAIGKWIRKK